MDGGHRQPGLLGQVGVAAPAVLGQQAHDLPVEILHGAHNKPERAAVALRRGTAVGAGRWLDAHSLLIREPGAPSRPTRGRTSPPYRSGLQTGGGDRLTPTGVPWRHGVAAEPAAAGTAGSAALPTIPAVTRMSEARPAVLPRTVRMECSPVPRGFRPHGQAGLATHSPSNLGDRVVSVPARALPRQVGEGRSDHRVPRHRRLPMTMMDSAAARSGLSR